MSLFKINNFNMMMVRDFVLYTARLYVILQLTDLVADYSYFVKLKLKLATFPAHNDVCS